MVSEVGMVKGTGMVTEWASTAYEGYREHTGGKSIATGQEIPTWENLAPTIQNAWRAAMVAVINSQISLRVGEVQPSHLSA